MVNQLLVVESSKLPSIVTVPANPVEYIAAVCNAVFELIAGSPSTTELILLINVETDLLAMGPGNASLSNSIVPLAPNCESAYVNVFVLSEVFVRYTVYERYCPSIPNVSPSAMFIVNCPLYSGVDVSFIVPIYFLSNTLSSV